MIETLGARIMQILLSMVTGRSQTSWSISGLHRLEATIFFVTRTCVPFREPNSEEP
jgi:hypothetical protein